MILSPPLVRAVASGRKTQHRVPYVASKRRPFAVEHHYPVGMRGRATTCRIRVLAVHHGPLEISFREARAEGHRTSSDFKAWWVGRYDRSWTQAQGDDVDELDVHARFDDRHAGRPVWIVTFEVEGDPVRFCARSRGSYDQAGQYTLNKARASDPVEVVPDHWLQREARARRERDAEQREQRSADARAERARRRLALFRDLAQ